jgi:hypothetical protein
MTKIKKVFSPLLTLGLSIALFSCNNSTEPKEATQKVVDSPVTAVAKPTPAPAAFTPFDIAEISHTVKDYAIWRPLFNSDSTARKASGMEDLVVARGFEKTNDIQVTLKISDIQKAKAFAADPRLKEVMAKGGVISKPTVEFFHVIRFNPDSKEKQWAVITHKVKDFDTWVKVFDNEGTANRAGQGLIDVVLARGIDDPNIVQLIFDIKDMAKAKASLFSEEKKKLMVGAGVEGKPNIEFYTEPNK